MPERYPRREDLLIPNRRHSKWAPKLAAVISAHVEQGDFEVIPGSLFFVTPRGRWAHDQCDCARVEVFGQLRPKGSARRSGLTFQIQSYHQPIEIIRQPDVLDQAWTDDSVRHAYDPRPRG